MSKDYSPGKSLSGYSILSGSLTDGIGNSLTSLIGGSNIVYSNIQITGGTIDGVVLGSQITGPVSATTLSSGSPGTGYQVCFYSSIINDSACWIPNIGLWNIQGSLLVRDSSNLGNLNISQNSIIASNSNGNISLITNGTGQLLINGGINQQTTTGNISLNTTNGSYNLVSGTTINSLSSGNTTTTTNDGDIVLQTGNNIPSFTISMSGSSVNGYSTITTSGINNLQTGDQITITGSNGSINGTFVISNILSNTSFTIPSNTVTSGTSGTIKRNNNIFLNATNSIYIPTNTNLTFGNINSNTSSLVSDGANTYLNTSHGNFTINGDLVVNGTSTYLESTVVTVKEPVFNIGGTTTVLSPDNMDRGISGEYYSNSSNAGKTMFFGRSNSSGCFTYIPNAIETSPNVFTGAPGCAIFGTLTVSSLNVTTGNVSNLGNVSISNLNTCNISCDGTMNISAANGIAITTPSTTLSGTLSSNGFSNTGTFTNTGTLTNNGSVSVSGNTSVSGNINGNNITAVNNVTGTSGFFTNITNSGTITTNSVNTSSITSATGTITTLSVSGTTNSNTINVTGNSQLNTVTANSITSTNTTSTNLSVTGTATVNNINSVNNNVSGTNTVATSIVTGNEIVNNNLSVSGNTNANNLNATGNTILNNLAVTGNVTQFPYLTYSTEHLSNPNIINPSMNIIITFVNINNSGVTTGSLGNAFYGDGQMKYVFLSSCVSGGSYQLRAINNLLDPGSGTTNSKTLTFNTAGQSIYLIWDNTITSWIIVNAGCCVS